MREAITTVSLSLLVEPLEKCFRIMERVKKEPKKTGTSHSIKPDHIPKVVVMPFPPLNLSSGVNMCPTTGAIHTRTNATGERSYVLVNMNTGIAPFKKSNTKDGIPNATPPALKLLVGPGL